MKKEVFIAIFAGFAIGLIATITIHSFRPDSTADKVITPTPTNENIGQTAGVTTETITILSPAQHTLTDKETITLKGTTNPNAMMTFISQDNQATTLANSSGNFSVDFDLEAGPNTIFIDSFAENGQKIEARFDITYSTFSLSEDEDVDTTEETEGLEEDV